MQFTYSNISFNCKFNQRFKILSMLSALILLNAQPSHAEHPLITDNTDVQGVGNTQLEINSDQSRSKSNVFNQEERIHQQVSNLALSYGLSPSLDLVISVPYVYDSSTQ